MPIRSGTFRLSLDRVFVLHLLVLLPGCSVHYYDEDTGNEHLWGFGHMVMRVSEPNEGVQARVGQTRTLGLSAGHHPDASHMTLGWHNETRLYAINPETSVRFEWPDNRLFNVRVGSLPPWEQAHEPDRKQEEVGQYPTEDIE